MRFMTRLRSNWSYLMNNRLRAFLKRYWEWELTSRRKELKVVLVEIADAKSRVLKYSDNPDKYTEKAEYVEVPAKYGSLDGRVVISDKTVEFTDNVIKVSFHNDLLEK